VLLLLIEGGILGLGSFAVLISVSIVAAWRSRLSAARPVDRTLGPALAAGVAAGCAILLFFDGLAFPISSGMVFFMCAVAGSSWVLRRPAELPGEGVHTAHPKPSRLPG
jgi:O-antigen ligase